MKRKTKAPKRTVTTSPRSLKIIRPKGYASIDATNETRTMIGAKAASINCLREGIFTSVISVLNRN